MVANRRFNKKSKSVVYKNPIRGGFRPTYTIMESSLQTVYWDAACYMRKVTLVDRRVPLIRANLMGILNYFCRLVQGSLSANHYNCVRDGISVGLRRSILNQSLIIIYRRSI